jgi:hypothetical protein
MKTVFLTAAQSGAIDQGSNFLSVFNILESFAAPTFPVALPVTVIAIFERDGNEPETPNIELVVTLTGRDKELFKGALSFSFQGKNRARIFALIQSLTVAGPGELSFETRYSGKMIGSWTVAVEQRTSPLNMQNASAPPEAPSSKTPTNRRAKKTKKATKKK